MRDTKPKSNQCCHPFGLCIYAFLPRMYYFNPLIHLIGSSVSPSQAYYVVERGLIGKIEILIVARCMPSIFIPSKFRFLLGLCRIPCVRVGFGQRRVCWNGWCSLGSCFANVYDGTRFLSLWCDVDLGGIGHTEMKDPEWFELYFTFGHASRHNSHKHEFTFWYSYWEAPR